MNNKKWFLYGVLFCAAPLSASSLYLIDRIEAVIFGNETTDLVTYSDIQRPSLDGTPRTKEDVMVERLMFQDALRHRIMIDEKTIDDYLEKIRKSYSVNNDEIKTMLQAAGYSFEEGRKQLGIMYANSQLIDHKIRSRLIIPDHEVVAYYHNHPLQKSASYLVEQSITKASEEKKEEMRKKIDHFLKTSRGLVVGWRQLPEIEEPDLAADKKFITTMKAGDIHVVETKQGFELYRLKKKDDERVVPLEDRYRDIVEILRRPTFEQRLAEYQQQLLTHASILYL
jgi:hypothetical protein